MIGKIHDVYYVFDELESLPVYGSESIIPSVAERRALTLNVLDGTTSRYSVKVWVQEMDVPIYGQRDPRWASEKLGFGVETIGNYGCVVTSLAMMLSAIEDVEITPLEINEELKAVNGFTGDTRNLVVWKSVEDAYPSVRFGGLDVCVTTPAPVSKIDKHIADDGCYCIIQVDMNPSPEVPGIQGHYVLITGGNGVNGYTIHDPWHAQVLTVPPAYCREGWNAARAITRVTYWSAV